MKVKFRTVQGKTFDLDFEDDTKVAEVKGKIQETQGDDFNKDALNIIYQGKILKDDASLKENNVSETGFCVVMVMKKKAAAPAETKAQAETSAQPAPAAAEAPPAPVPAAATAAPEATPTPAAAAPAEAAPETEEQMHSELATGSHLEGRISQIMEMGFPREDVVRAMRAAFNNTERAVEYLMTGIPEGLDMPPVSRAPPSGGQQGGAGGQQAQQQPAAVTSQPFNMFGPPPAGGAPGAGGGEGGGGPLDFLRSNPQFQALKAIVQQNPALLQPMLLELGRNNPAMLQQIQAHQSEFLAMINEPVAEGEQQGLQQMLQQMAAEAEGAEGGEGAVQIELTEEEAAAVERLASMGFDRDMCLEAFLICDKNEALAANYLLENSMNM